MILGPLALMNRILNRALQTDFSFEGVRTHMNDKFAEILSTPPNAET
jgi:hypothetical protein